MNLGQKLKRMQEEAEIDERERRMLALVPVSETTRTHLGILQCFFETAKYTVSRDINDKGVVPQGIVVGPRTFTSVARILGFSAERQGPTIENRQHPYHFVWHRFTQWAQDNGLQAAFNFRTDTVGKESWYELAVEPLPA